MGRQFRNEGGDYPQDVTRLKDRVPEPKDLRDLDSHSAAAYAADCELDLHHDQIDKAAKEQPYRNITQIATDSGRTATTAPTTVSQRGRGSER